MLAPPPPILLDSLDGDENGPIKIDDESPMNRGYRSNSCYSDITNLISGLQTPPSGHSSRRPSRAFLLRQKSTGEEMVLVMTPVKAGGVPAKTVVSKVPTYVTTSGKKLNQPIAIKTSTDDSKVTYHSLMALDGSVDRRHSVLVASPTALEAKRLEKLYQMLRRQAATGMNQMPNDKSDPTDPKNRLDNWLLELEEKRRQEQGKQSVTEFLLAPVDPSNRRRGSHSPRIQQACNTNDPDYLNLPPIQRAISQQGTDSIYPNAARRMSSLRRPSRCPGASRRSSGGSGKPYPTTSRRCSEAVAAYAATGDIEAAAAILRGDGEIDDDDNDEFTTPPEKERRRMAIAVSCVAVAITILAAAMVGLTLGLSHMMDGLSSQHKMNETQMSLLTNLSSSIDDNSSGTIAIPPGGTGTRTDTRLLSSFFRDTVRQNNRLYQNSIKLNSNSKIVPKPSNVKSYDLTFKQPSPEVESITVVAENSDFSSYYHPMSEVS